MARDVHAKWIAALLALMVCSAQPAFAAERTFQFDIPPRPLGAAMIDFALATGLSVSTARASKCGPATHALRGRFAAERGLRLMLEGTGCSYRFIDARALELVPLPRPYPAPVTRDTSPTPLDPLVVVATQRPTLADRLAYGVSVANVKALSDQGLRGAEDLALTTPAMIVTNLGAGRDKILLRGLSDGPLTGRTQAMVGIYLGQTRLTYNAPDPDLRWVDMAQVEVLRGPQGALYGAGSLGGVVRLGPTPPDRSARKGWLAAELGATKDGAGSSTIEGVFNQPILGDRAAVRLVAYRERLGGYIDNSGLGLANVNLTTRAGLRAQADLDLGSDWTVSTTITNQTINAKDTQYVLVGAPNLSRSNQVREPHDNDFFLADVTLKRRFAWGEGRWTSAYIRHEVTSRYDASTASPVPGPAGPVAYDDVDQISSVVNEASLVSNPSARLQWLAGAFLAVTREKISLDLTSLATPPRALFSEARTDRREEAAVFGEVVTPLTPSLDLTLGGRAFLSQVHVSSQLQQGPGEARFTGRQKGRGIAPKIVLAYTATPSLLVYLQAAEGYRSGGFNTTTTLGLSAPPRQFSGDELWSFEAGGKLSLLEGRLRARAAIFEVDWKNIQSDQLLASGLPYTANIGDGGNVGLELELAYKTEALSLGASGVLNAPEVERPDPAFAIHGDLALAAVPKVAANAFASYVWALPSGRSVTVEGRLGYVGASRLTLDAERSRPMGGYATGRVAATLAADPWRLTLSLDNLGDSDRDTFAYGNPFLSAPVSTPLRPRKLSLRVVVDY